MSGVTDADRERAAELGGPHESWCNFVAHADCCHDGRDERFSCECGTWPRKRLIAAALAEERGKARAPFLALLAEEEAEAREHYAVTVEVPMAVGSEVIERIFMAVSDAAYEAQPEQRDWDVFVHGCGPTHQGVPLHFLRRAAEATE